MGAHPLDTVAKINTSAAFPSGAHVAEVEIDPDTGAMEVVSYVAVDDCGKVYNHTLVEAQLHGGLMQGIGQVLGEHCVYDRDTGQLLTGTFMDYFMPRADCLPRDRGCMTGPIPSPEQSARRQGRRRGRHHRRRSDHCQRRHGRARAARHPSAGDAVHAAPHLGGAACTRTVVDAGRAGRRSGRAAKEQVRARAPSGSCSRDGTFHRLAGSPGAGPRNARALEM